ncbi:MAG: TPM domain-containing protein [Steroidobacteraceae bacterium]
MMRRAAWLLAFALLGATGGHAAGLQPVPALGARVTDLTGTLTAVEQSALEQKLAAFQARKGAEVAVLVVATTAPEAIEQYSIRVVEAWKLGRAKPDDGALLLLAKDDHALRIEVGRGLEGALTDAMSNRIIEDTMVPLLRQGQFATAINAGVDQMLRVIDGEELPPPEQAWQPSANLMNALPFLFVAFLVGSAILRAIFGRTGGAALSGGLMGLAVYVLSKLLPIALGAGVVAFIIALVMGLGRGAGWSSGRAGFGGGGLGGGFGGGFGGGGGGFSGGGGSFGGGGASGRW